MKTENYKFWENVQSELHKNFDNVRLSAEHVQWLSENFNRLPNGSNLPVSGSLPLSDYAKRKLDFINGHSTAREFPNQQPTMEWVGCVLDFLEELKLRQ